MTRTLRSLIAAAAFAVVAAVTVFTPDVPPCQRFTIAGESWAAVGWDPAAGFDPAALCAAPAGVVLFEDGSVFYDTPQEKFRGKG